MNEPEIEPEESPSHAPSLAQRRLGRYVLCYELASGGMATVYLARTEGPQGFGRLVAIKVIHPHLAGQQEFVEMFLDEARVASRIVHPNVCSVFDFGEQDGTYYLAMDYLVGENAGRVMRSIARNREIAARPEVPKLMARIVADACEGLHAAHELRGDDGELVNLVHRDVTPHNLFVGYDGSVRVVDFGVALAVGRTHHTAAGTLKGKFPYMSPEQIATNEVDRRSDVWALGVCFWELLVRRRLFRRDNEFQTLKAVTEAVIPAPSTMSAGVPAVFDAIVARALDRDRSKRYATAREMGRDLNAALGTLGGAGSAEVAELMDQLFATERAERAVLLEKARRVDAEMPSTSRITRVGLHETGSALVTAPPATGSTTPPESRKRAMIGIGVAGVSLLALVGIAALSQSSSTDGPVAEGTEAPEPTTPSLEAPATPTEAPIAVAEAPEQPAVPDPVPTAPTAPVVPTETRPRTERTPRIRPETSAPPTRAGVGTVNVVTPPGWAEIFVDGERVGRTPTSIQLPAGRRSVRLMPYGEGPAITRSVEVTADETTRLVVRLEASE